MAPRIPSRAASALASRLASLLTAAEQAGGPIPSISLRLARCEDASWAEPALEWLHTHGRRVIVRTAAALPRSFVDAIRRRGAVVQLELAHHTFALQRALVGPTAERASSLLLQAQHLRQLGVGVVAHLGPVFPAIHERGLAPLLSHVAAAGLVDVHICPGVLTVARLAALTPILEDGARHHLRRVYGLGTEGEARGGPWRLRPLTRRALKERLGRLVRDHGLAPDRCGCPVACHLDRARHVKRPALVTFEPRDLFAPATSATG